MLCSSCSCEVKPVVAFDIDGVLGDYHSHFTAFCLNYWQHATLRSQPYDGSMEFEEWLGLTKIEYREAKLAYRQGGFKRWLPIYPGAVEAVRTVRDAGCDVWIATTRPWQLLNNIDPDTREWLRRHSIRYDGLLYGDDKYRQLCESVDPDRIIAVVDDLSVQCGLAEKDGLKAFQVERPHNAADRVNASGTLEEITSWIHNMIFLWRRKYA